MSVIRLRVPCDSAVDFYARYLGQLAQPFFVAFEIEGEEERVEVHVSLTGAKMRLKGEGIARASTKDGRKGIAIQLQSLEGDGVRLPLSGQEPDDAEEGFFDDAATLASNVPSELAERLKASLNMQVSKSVVPRQKLTKTPPPELVDAGGSNPPDMLELERLTGPELSQQHPDFTGEGVVALTDEPLPDIAEPDDDDDVEDVAGSDRLATEEDAEDLSHEVVSDHAIDMPDSTDDAAASADVEPSPPPSAVALPAKDTSGRAEHLDDTGTRGAVRAAVIGVLIGVLAALLLYVFRDALGLSNWLSR